MQLSRGVQSSSWRHPFLKQIANQNLENMMFAIPRHNSLQVYDNAQDAGFFERTDLTVYQIQDLQIDSLLLGPKGGTFTLYPNGSTSFTGDIKMRGKRHFPAIFELTTHKRSEISLTLPKNASHPWQSLSDMLDVRWEWINGWNSNRFSVRLSGSKSMLVEIGARYYFNTYGKKVQTDAVAFPFDIKAVQE